MSSEGSEPDLLLRLVVQFVPVVAPAPLGGFDMDPAGGPVDGAGEAQGLDESLSKAHLLQYLHPLGIAPV